MKIYVMDIRPFESEEVYSRMLAYVTLERQKKIASMKHRKDQCRSLAAGLLLEYILRQSGRSLLCATNERAELIRGEYGKPYLKGMEDFFFNLSHAGDWAAGVFSEQEVGIDIEKIKIGTLNIAKRFFCEEEYQYLLHLEETQQDKCFTELWTRKESYVKAVGVGLAMELSSFSVLGAQAVSVKSNLPKERAKWYLYTLALNKEYVLSVCTKCRTKLAVQQIFAESLFS